jgi:hypothetical protein
MHSLNGLAGSFIGIFIPIYLLTLQYSLRQVFAYYLLYAICILVLFVFTSFVARHIGLRRTLLAYLPFQFAYFGLLYALPQVNFPLWIIAITSATATSLYWYPLHLFFIEKARTKEMGASVGKLYALPKFVTLLSPLIGAYIAARFGFSALLLITISLYLLTSISLAYLPDIYPDIQFKLERFFILVRKYPRYILAEIGENIREELEGIVLPIIIFVTFGNIYSVGLIGTLLNLGTAFFLIVVGRSADRFKRTNILRIGAILMMMLWTAFFYVQGELSFYILTLAESFLGALLLVPFNAIVYDYAKADDVPAEFIVFREIPVTFARIVVYSISIMLVYALPHVFFLPVLGSLLFFFL